MWPRPPEWLDRDPLALLLGAFATGLALAYLVAGLAGAGVRLRAALIGSGALGLVVLPTAALITMGAAAHRPYGQDGGVVQLPLALDKLLSGHSPYGADYSDSILGKEARASWFWGPQGGNPILHHHAYLPGTHLLMMPAYLACRALGRGFDPRLVTLAFYGLGVFLALRLVEGSARQLVAAAAVAVNPLVYWQQAFGANDIITAALLMSSVLLAERRRPVASSAVLGLACATKQLAWPFAPFVIAYLADVPDIRSLAAPPARGRLLRATLIALATFAVVVLPVAALDPRAFWGDIVVYNVGLPGGDNYPLGGTPGFGLANFLIYFGGVTSLRDYVPFGVFYLLLIPLGIALLGRQLRVRAAGAVLLCGSAALLASVYVSRVVHPNYLILAAVLLPIGALSARWPPADVVVAPLALLAVAVEVADGELFRSAWERAVAARVPLHLGGLPALLAPRSGPSLTLDPIGLAVSAAAAGCGIAYLLAGVLTRRELARWTAWAAAVLLVIVVPAHVLAAVGRATGAEIAQHPWMAQSAREAASAFGSAPAALVRAEQAWSTSFRGDPPRPLAEVGVFVPPGSVTIAWVLGRLGLADPHPLILGGLALAFALAIRAAVAGRLLAAAVLLAPPFAVGVAFGAPAGLTLALLLATHALARRGHASAAGAAQGLAAALDHRALLAAPFLLGLDRDRRIGRILAGGAAGYVVLALPAIVARPGGAWPAFLPSALGPAPGLASVLLCWDLAWKPFAILLTVTSWAAGLAAFTVARRRVEAPPLALAAAGYLTGLFLSVRAEPDDLGIAIGLLALSVVVPESDPASP